MKQSVRIKYLVLGALACQMVSAVYAADVTEAISTRQTLSDHTNVTIAEPNVTSRSRMLAALYSNYGSYDVSKQNPMIVNVNDKDLHLTVNGPRSNGGIASAMYVGTNQYITIDNVSSNGLRLTATNLDTRASNGVYVDGNGHLTINDNVIIDKAETKGDAAAGISIIGQGSDVTINGDLNIRNIEGIRGRGNGINASGIRVTGEKSSVIVNGNVDIEGVKGTAIHNVGANTYTSFQGGRIVTAEDSDFTKKYHAIRVDRGIVDINMKTDDKVPGNSNVDITGDIIVNKEEGKAIIEYTGGMLRDVNNKGILNLALTTKDSKLDGLIGYDIGKRDFGSGGYQETKIGTTTLYLQNGATWINRQHTSAGDKFEGSFVANLVGGISDASAGVIAQKDERPIRIGNMAGHSILVYDHEGDGQHASDYKAGNVTVERAVKGAQLTLSTSSQGIDRTKPEIVTGALNTLANKLLYEAYRNGERNLNGRVQLASGLTASTIEADVKPITFTDEGVGTYVYTEPPVKPPVNPPVDPPVTPPVTPPVDPPVTPPVDPPVTPPIDPPVTPPVDPPVTPPVDPPVTPPVDPPVTPPVTPPVNPPVTPPRVLSYETPIMQGLRSSFTTAALAWRNGALHQHNRLFELRDGAETGVWTSTRHGKWDYNNHGLDVDITSHSYTLGYDGIVGKGWRAGAEITYDTSKGEFLYGGTSDVKSVSLGAYGTKKMGNAYIDLGASFGRLSNDISVYNEIGERLTADYKTYGFSVSGQYGKRFHKGSFYIEPQGELIYSRLNDTELTAYRGSDGMRIEQDAMNSMVGRLGIEIGKVNNNSRIYSRLSVLHEFDGEASTTYKALDGGMKSTNVDIQDTWASLLVGANYTFHDNFNVYVEGYTDIGGSHGNARAISLGLKYMF
ncbi:autotransporter outer membrane beta-barrel domain-containing protein [Veillonella agrestimuris]|uniref:autotransporter family protein n=1 Tax=Veillonella agrestimuris TaxID=2941340 RepID=UPI0020401AD2|nr:autotransporter outer membrane beta-barrel domain-containing protein [Veillonella agrestimuris]